MIITKTEMAKMIDHTMLKPAATEEEIAQLCREAADMGFATVCVNPSFIPQAVKTLKNTEVSVCTVVGFPLGATSKATKAFEAAEAVRRGAKEIDMVINVGFLKSGRTEDVLQDIRAVVEAVVGADNSAIVKVIIETCLLTDDEKVMACLLSKEAGAHFVKTSTGFSTGGATVQDIALMRNTVGAEMGVKASGGIRNTEQAIAMIKAGANRIGASAGLEIIAGIDL